MQTTSYDRGKATPLRRIEARMHDTHAAQYLEASAVRTAREYGCTWAEIAAIYGVSKQAVQQRFPAPGVGTGHLFA
jgi:hypothetical protein